MNKENIYQVIGYQGEYNASVKKALRKLLKENHPDHHGKREIFELINEVKKELETNKVTYKHSKKTKNSYDDIDYEYCQDELKKLQNQKKVLLKRKKEIEDELNELEKEYGDKYYQSLNYEKNLLDNDGKIKKLNLLKRLNIILLFSLIISFGLFCLIRNNILLYVACLIGFLFILLFVKYYKYSNEVNNYSKKIVRKYVDLARNNEEIRNKKKRKQEIFLKIKREMNAIDNNIRFYNNILNNKE